VPTATTDARTLAIVACRSASAGVACASAAPIAAPAASRAKAARRFRKSMAGS